MLSLFVDWIPSALWRHVLNPQPSILLQIFIFLQNYFCEYILKIFWYDTKESFISRKYYCKLLQPLLI